MFVTFFLQDDKIDMLEELFRQLENCNLFENETSYYFRLRNLTIPALCYSDFIETNKNIRSRSNVEKFEILLLNFYFLHLPANQLPFQNFDDRAVVQCLITLFDIFSNIASQFSDKICFEEQHFCKNIEKCIFSRIFHEVLYMVEIYGVQCLEVEHFHNLAAVKRIAKRPYCGLCFKESKPDLGFCFFLNCGNLFCINCYFLYRTICDDASWVIYFIILTYIRYMWV